MKNVIVAQSGGPSPVINASLAGVIAACADFPGSFGRVFAGWHGIEGILREELLDLSCQPRDQIALLRSTPAAGVIGTCRYKLRPTQAEDFSRIVDVMRAHDAGWFFYIGGNDSMDTADKLSGLARSRGVGLVVTGVPKTIDNDVGDDEFKLVDHTPGYGSAARYWASITRDAEEENRGMSPSESVLVLQAMGRTAGFVPAAARLADPDRQFPLQIYTAESGHSLASLTHHVNEQLCRTGRCIVVVSEGFNVGSLGEQHDGFGHVEYGACETTVAQVVVNHLNRTTLAVRGKATGQVPGILQRSTSLHASTVDMAEAYEVGRAAVSIALDHGTGWMATILRAPGATYRASFGKVPLSHVANFHRQLPKQWLAKDGLDVTDDFIRYAQPLIGDGMPPFVFRNGVPQFARFEPAFAEKKLPAYVPQAYRSG